MYKCFLVLSAIGLAACSPKSELPVEKQNVQTEKPVSNEFIPSFTGLGQGDIVDFPGHQVFHHIKTSDLPAEVSLTELVLAPKMLGAPPHIHQDEDEIFVILSGRVHFLAGSEEVVGKTGTIAALPRGHFHGFWNPYDEPATILLMITPGHFEEFFGDVEAAIQEGGPKSPPEIGAIIAQKAAERNVNVDMSKLPPSALALLGPPSE